MPDVVAITGAAGALGSAVARHLAAGGYRPALLDMPRSSAGLQALAKELGACAIEADFGAPGAWSGVLATIERDLGGPPSHAVLIAGGWQGGKPLYADADDDATWRAMMDSNLETVHRSLRALLPGMVSRRRGSIVVIGSRVVERPWTGAGAAAYTASKAAAVALAQTAAAEVLDKGVRVNAILPSTLDTLANRHSMPKADPSEWVALPSAAAVIAFLLSDNARDISGAALPLYGRAP